MSFKYIFLSSFYILILIVPVINLATLDRLIYLFKVKLPKIFKWYVTWMEWEMCKAIEFSFNSTEFNTLLLNTCLPDTLSYFISFSQLPYEVDVIQSCKGGNRSSES